MMTGTIPSRDRFFSLILGLLLLSASPTPMAAESVHGDEPSAASPLQLENLVLGPPIGQGHAYRVSFSLELKNRAPVRVSSSNLSFFYTTSTGRRHSGLNPETPAADTQVWQLPKLEPGEFRRIEGSLLLPIIWYRGEGVLSARVEIGGHPPASIQTPLRLY